jgi:hypothetical protein
MGSERFLPHPLPFVIPSNPTIERYIIYAVKILLHNRRNADNAIIQGLYRKVDIFSGNQNTPWLYGIQAFIATFANTSYSEQLLFI